MNIQKLVIIVAALAINVLALAAFHTWSTAAMASVAPGTRGHTIVTLPTVRVTPTAAQLRELRGERVIGVAPAPGKRA